MSEKVTFDISSGIITSDSYNVEIKGFYLGLKDSKSAINSMIQSYASKTKFNDLLALIEEENIVQMEEFNSLNLDKLKFVTINAIHVEDHSETYAINPDLEGKKKKKGFFSRFKK